MPQMGRLHGRGCWDNERGDAEREERGRSAGASSLGPVAVRSTADSPAAAPAVARRNPAPTGRRPPRSAGSSTRPVQRPPNPGRNRSPSWRRPLWSAQTPTRPFQRPPWPGGIPRRPGDGRRGPIKRRRARFSARRGPEESRADREMAVAVRSNADLRSSAASDPPENCFRPISAAVGTPKKSDRPPTVSRRHPAGIGRPSARARRHPAGIGRPSARARRHPVRNARAPSTWRAPAASFREIARSHRGAALPNRSGPGGRPCPRRRSPPADGSRRRTAVGSRPGADGA